MRPAGAGAIETGVKRGAPVPAAALPAAGALVPAALVAGHALSRGMDKMLGGFFRRFNNVFQKASDSYSGGVKRVISRKAAIMGALSLYLDFLNIFLFLLRFMGNRR